LREENLRFSIMVISRRTIWRDICSILLRKRMIRSSDRSLNTNSGRSKRRIE
jgi:hypothetical protein